MRPGTPGMNILHLIATLAPESGGPAQACLEMASAVAARGHNVSIYTTDFGGHPKPSTPEQAAVDIQVFPVQWPSAWKPSFPMARQLADRIDTYDVVHLHSLYLFHDWVGGVMARRAKVPYIVRPHGLLDPYIWKRSRARKWLTEVLFQTRVLEHAAAIHYTSELEREISAPYAGPAPPRIVPLGVRLDELETLPSPEIFHQRFPETAGRRVVLFLSRLHEKKGLDLLVPAFAAALQGAPDLHLAIAGPDDGVLERTQALVREHGIAQHTTFTGMLKGEDKLSAFAASSMFALPSYSENFGIAVVEAMAAGVPVVISDQVNIYRDIADRGAIVVPCEVAPLARAIAQLAADPVRARALGSEARATARQLYDWGNVAAALEQLYAEVAR
jgi:glycosyltransferase involved in cell wall biosynthesis